MISNLFAPRKFTLLVVFFFVLVTPLIVYAEGEDSSRELSNLSVIGIERLEAPTQRDNFSMMQYLPDPIEGFNRGSLAVSKPVIDWFVKPLAKGWRFITPTGCLKP
jgi:hypothetical protein